MVEPPQLAKTVYQISYAAELLSLINMCFALPDIGVTTPEPWFALKSLAAVELILPGCPLLLLPKAT